MSKQLLYKEINLWRCEPGDVLECRDGDRIKYSEFRMHRGQVHIVGMRCYNSDGCYYPNGMESHADIVAILKGRGRTR